jgi:tripartite-type tricarboxylate transporter receptor subunit TctC
LYKALEEITSLPEYKEGTEKAGLPGAFLHGDEWAELIASQQEEAERVLKQFDLIK